MALQASVILNRVSTTLLDPNNVNWSSAELLDYLNAAISAIVAVKPDASTVVTNFVVTNNQAKQSIPADGIQLVDVIRNVSTASTPIRQIERNHLNHADPDWPVTPVPFGKEIQHFIYDYRTPTIFWIYPQPTSGTNTIELSYLKEPTRLTAPTDTIPVTDIYENPLHHFVCAYAYAKNSKRTDLAKAQTYWQMFANSIQMRSEIQLRYSPFTPKEMPGGQTPEVGGVNQ